MHEFTHIYTCMEQEFMAGEEDTMWDLLNRCLRRKCETRTHANNLFGCVRVCAHVYVYILVY